MPKFEKPQTKNRRRFTIRQHILPVASIARFADATGTVALLDKSRGTCRRAHPNDNMFCAMRAWDQSAEAGYMKRIEDNFQNIASAIVDSSSSSIGEPEIVAINIFYALWYWRARQRRLTVLDVAIPNTSVSRLTHDQAENLELNGYMYADGGRMKTRFINSIQLLVFAHRWADTVLSNSRWGIIRASEGEFIVPDVPVHTIVPLSPKMCLMSPSPHGLITKENAALINREVVAASREYYFARDLAACPL